MATVRVFLIRHGETALNAAGVLRGQLDVPLNEVGQAEALALGGTFLNVPLAGVVSSPLCRAVETARPLAAASGAPLRIDERLSDRFYGELAGYSLEQVEEQFGSIDAAPLVEAWQLLEARAEDAFSSGVALGQSHPARSVALVTHDAVIRALLRLLVEDLVSVKIDLPTGSWTELQSGPAARPWTVVHLGELPAAGPPAVG